MPKRTVTNLAVTSQIPLNTDGMDYGREYRRTIESLELVRLGRPCCWWPGWIYQTAAFPDKMPQQIFQFAPPDPAIASAPVFAKVALGEAEYDSASQTLTVTTQVTNTGDTPMNLHQFTTEALQVRHGHDGRAGGDDGLALTHHRAGADPGDHDHEGPGMGDRAPGP